MQYLSLFSHFAVGENKGKEYKLVISHIGKDEYQVAIEIFPDSVIHYSEKYNYHPTNIIDSVIMYGFEKQLLLYFQEELLPIKRVSLYRSGKNFILEYNSKIQSLSIYNLDSKNFEKLLHIDSLFIFSDIKKKECEFEVYTSESFCAHSTLIEQLTPNQFLITGYGAVFFNDKNVENDNYDDNDNYNYNDNDENCYILWTPPSGTIFKHSVTSQLIEICDNKIYNIREEPNIKYMFYRCIPDHEISTIAPELISELCKKHNVNRVVNQNSFIYWIDSETGKLAELKLGDGKIFDELTQMNVEFKNGRISAKDPKARISIVNHSLTCQDYKDVPGLDYIRYSDLEDGEYTDYCTDNKFAVKDGKLVHEIITTYLIFPEFYPNSEKNLEILKENEILCLKSKRIYKLSLDDKVISSQAKFNCYYQDCNSLNSIIMYYLTEEGYQMCTK